MKQSFTRPRLTATHKSNQPVLETTSNHNIPSIPSAYSINLPTKRPHSRETKVNERKVVHSRETTIEVSSRNNNKSLANKYRFAPMSNIAMLKSIMTRSIQVESEKFIDDKIQSSPLYKKLVHEFQSLKLGFAKEIQ